MDSLVYPGERSRKRVAMIIAGIFWLLLIVGTVGAALLYLLFFYLFYLFAQSGLIAYLRGTAVRISARQMPDLNERIARCCARLDVKKVPEAYLLHGNGVFNAFATRFLGRDFIVLFSDVVDALDERPGAIDFYIGHELGHIRQKHLLWAPFLAPALMLPLLGAAYSRAREYTCDRHGLAVCENSGDALRGMVALAAGHQRWKSVSLPEYQDQAQFTGGFWMSLHELLSDYPWLTKRVVWSAALSEKTRPELPSRNPLALLFALFVPRVPAAGGAGGLLVVVAVIGVLAAIAIPAYQDYTIRASTMAALAAAQPYEQGVLKYIQEHNERPSSNEDIGLGAEPQPPVPGIAGIEVGDQGEITIEFSAKGIAGKTLSLTPSIDDDHLTWQCHSDDLLPKHLPSSCR